MIVVYLLIGAVLGSLSTAIYFNHRQETEQGARVAGMPQAYTRMYTYALQRFSKSSIPRLRQTHTITSSQKRLLVMLSESSELVGMVRSMVKEPQHLLPNFLIDMDHTEFDRNGCIELWVHVSDDVSEVYYIPEKNVGLLASILGDMNSVFAKQISIITQGTAE